MMILIASKKKKELTIIKSLALSFGMAMVSLVTYIIKKF